MSAELTREDLDRLAAYADRRAAEWSRAMDSEQAHCEPDERCAVSISELQGLVAMARSGPDSAERLKEADELLDSAMRMVGGSWEQELETYRTKWGAK